MSTGSNSNIDAVAADIEAIVASYDFTLPGDDQSLGRDLAGVVATGIADRSAQGKAPNGSDWAENREPYKSRKAKRYSALLPNELTGQMLSLESLKGQTTIAADAVEMKYGTGEAATRARTGPADARDCVATDQQKAEWTTEGASGPPRPFYELDNAIADECQKVAGEALVKHLKGS